MKWHIWLSILILFPLIAVQHALGQENPVDVYILAGQSNMQGQGAVDHLGHLIDDEETRDEFQHLRNEKGEWVVRDDVFVFCIGRDKKGGLSPGFGAKEEKIGPELGFGTIVGNATERPVLIIKTCWGGRNLKEDYLPPSSGGPGRSYTELVEGIRELLEQRDVLFPQLQGRTCRMAGFVWFQGWNDMVDGEQRKDKYKDYSIRLANLIRDLRTEFDAPDMPAVVGELGVGGPDKRGEFQLAQKAATEFADLADNTEFATTSEFYDMAIDKLYRDDVWKGPDKEIFYRVGSDRPYHYLGSGKIYYRMGVAFGETMLELRRADD